jgi:transcriptional regulator with XRE-family HTH domain
MARKVGLREFLRTRRARIRPQDVGLAVSGYRRVPGLRREELAALAGISVDYYVRLEQGRDLCPSDSVLDALARALRLDAVERTHLYDLARSDQAPAVVETETAALRPNVRRLLDYLDAPALVVGRGTVVLGSNALSRALMTDFDDLPPGQRYFAQWIFLDPIPRELYLDWEIPARETVGVLRRDVARHPEDSALHSLIGELSAGSAQFRDWWADHDVDTHNSGTKRYNHPIAGELTVFHEATQLHDDEQWLYLYWVEPGSRSEQAMRLLGSWAATLQTKTSTQDAALDRSAAYPRPEQSRTRPTGD